MNKKNLVAAALILAGMVLASSGILAQRGRGSAPPLPTYKSEEYLLLGNSMRGAGEPMVAVDPVDPKNIIVVAMGNLQQPEGKPVMANGTDAYHHITKSTITWLAVSNDGGLNWEISELPILSGKLTRCPDSFADVLKDGTFIAGCEPRETMTSDPDFYGMSALVISSDHGKTWGPMVQIISDYQLNRFAPGLKPVSGGFPKGTPTRVASNSPWDRPFTFIDDSTGVIYGQAGGGQAYTDEAGTQRRSQAYLTASTDNGKSFGTVYSWDSPQYPQESRGLGMAAAGGTVVVNYTASSVPATENTKCPCPVWGISKDRGKTFTYHVLKNLASAGRTGGPVAADQTKPGRFAMLLSQGAKYSVMVTEDFGQTWSPIVEAATVPEATGFSKPSLDFSRDGVLGLAWRAIYADGTYDIWALISKDSGKTFSKPLGVSHAKSPARDPYRNGGQFGDDIQDLSMDKVNMHLAWGDSRAGFQGVWYGRVKLADFEF
jgi:hypothetical protein